jgi:hypothetical protein
LISDTSFSSLSSSKPESETNDIVTVSDNVVHDDNFPTPAFSLPVPPPPPPSFQSNNNNNYKSDIPKPDPTKVRKLVFNVITSLQEKVHSLESGMHGLRDKIDDEFEKFDEKYSDK